MRNEYGRRWCNGITKEGSMKRCVNERWNNGLKEKKWSKTKSIDNSHELIIRMRDRDDDLSILDKKII